MKPFTSHPALRRFPVHRDLALLILTVVGCAIPFLTQPFHMDDNFYMDMARNARAEPLHPNDTPYDFGGFHVPDMASHTHPPMQTYFLALVQGIAGEGEGREWIYHSAALIFPLLAAVSLYFISALFVERPIWPSMAMAVSPVVLVMEHTLMTDVPMLAFWLGAVACFLWATETNRKRLYLASSLLQFAAMFTGYQAILLFPLLAFYQNRKRGRAFGWFALALPLAAMGAWLGMSSLHYGRITLLDTIGYVQSRNADAWKVLGTKVLALMEYQGWLVVFPLFILYVLARSLKGRLLGMTLLLAAFFAQAAIPDYRLLDKAIFVLGLVTGIFITAHMGIVLRDAFHRRETEAGGFGRVEAQFVALWYFGVAAYCLILFTEGSARYILPLVPPFLICYFRRLEVAETSEYRANLQPLMNSAMVASGSLVLTLAWGMLLSQADYEFARIYPRAAAAFARMSAGLDAYVTGEWGFRYYFSRVGAGALPADESAVIGGSLLVKPKLAMPYDPPAGLQSMSKPFASLAFELKTPFRIMDWRAPAGFYSTGWGKIPFSLSNRSLEVIEIQQVNFMVERLPWARMVCAGSVKPWPGIVPIGTGALAILARPGTRIIYPWTLRGPMRLLLKVGVLDAAAAENRDFDFEIVHLDAHGGVLSEYAKRMNPGKRQEDSGWHAADLSLRASVEDGETLEFRFHARSGGEATGAFAEAFLMPAATRSAELAGERK